MLVLLVELRQVLRAGRLGVKKEQEAWTDLATWPVVGCQRRYQPWKFGQGMGIEYRTIEQEWKAFRADFIPEVLHDALKKRRVDCAMAALPLADIYYSRGCIQW